MKAKALVAAAAIIPAAGCISPLDEGTEALSGESTVRLEVVCQEESATKSAAFGHLGSAITDADIYIWDGDRPVSRDRVTASGGALSLTKTLTVGREYGIYVLANTGQQAFLSGEQPGSREEMESLSVSFEGAGDMENFPMAGSRSVVITSQMQSVSVPVQRLMSRIAFRCCPEGPLAGQDFRVSSVSLRNAAAQVFPFREASRAESALEGIFDSASAEDLERLREGGEVYFFVPENCRGTLLPGNTDPWAKVPENLSAQERSLATYLEVECTMSGEGVMDGQATYRFFPGSDNTTNFDIVRNTGYTVTLIPTLDALEKSSWKVTSDVWYTGNRLVTLEQEAGLHRLSDSYVGEMALLRLSGIDPSVTDYFGGSTDDMIRGMRLECTDASGNALLSFGGSPVTDGDGIAGIEATALRKGTGTLWLCDGAGHRLVPLTEDVSIAYPQLMLSFQDGEGVDWPEPLDEAPEALINTKSCDISLFLCDSGGRNLLSGDAYGFSGEPFAFGAEAVPQAYARILTSSSEVSINADCTRMYKGQGRGTAGQPFAVWSYSVTNTGKDLEAAKALAEGCSRAGFIKLHVRDTLGGSLVTAQMNVGCAPLEFITQPRLSPAYRGEVIAVTNPSHLPLHLETYELTFINTPSAAKVPAIGTESNLTAISGALPDVPVTFYGMAAYREFSILSSPVYGVGLNRESEDVTVSGDVYSVSYETVPFLGFFDMAETNRILSGREDASSGTFVVADLTLQGVTGCHSQWGMSVSEDQEIPTGTETYYGGFEGCCLFSGGTFRGGSVTNEASTGACCMTGSRIIYSPATMSELQSTRNSLRTSTTGLITGSGSRYTKYLTFTNPSRAKTVDVSLRISGYGEVTLKAKKASSNTRTYLCGPDISAVSAKANSGSSASSSWYRCHTDLRQTYTATVEPGTTVDLLPMKSFVDTHIFSKTETDYYNADFASNKFQHQYHPINYRLDLSVSTRRPEDVFAGTFYPEQGATGRAEAAARLFSAPNYYFNTGYSDNNRSNDAGTTFNFKCHRIYTSGIGYLGVMK